MVDEASKHAEDDRLAKEKIEARNGLDSYAHSIKKAINEEQMASKIDAEDKKVIETAVAEVQQWLEKNISAEKDEIEHVKQEFEKKVTPIMTKIYQGAQGAQGGMPGGMPGGFPGGGFPGGFPQGGFPQGGGFPGGFGGAQPTAGEGATPQGGSGPKIEEVD